MKNIDVSWSDVKAFIDDKGLSAQFVETTKAYFITAIDGPFSLSCKIKKDSSSDQTEFEASYKASGNKTLEKKAPEQNIPRVAVYKAEGSGTTKVSHDWTDPTTWYNQSVRVTGESPAFVSGTTYDLANDKIIDLTHGKLYAEDDFLSGHEVKVYDEGVELTAADAFTVDYDNGSITLKDAAGGLVTCDYSYANGSCWVLAPDAGKMLHLEHAELNLSKDIAMSSGVSFEIWVYNPYDPPNKVLYKKIRYKNIKDIINAANLGQGYIPACGGLAQDILIFPFNYVTLQTMKDSQGAELRVKIDDDAPFTGEWATATFYIMSEDE